MDAEFLYFSETELLPFDSNKVPEIKEIASSLSPDLTIPPTPQVLYA